MANKPLLYTLIERKATLGKYAGKTVLQPARRDAGASITAIFAKR